MMSGKPEPINAAAVAAVGDRPWLAAEFRAEESNGAVYGKMVIADPTGWAVGGVPVTPPRLTVKVVVPPTVDIPVTVITSLSISIWKFGMAGKPLTAAAVTVPPDAPSAAV